MLPTMHPIAPLGGQPLLVFLIQVGVLLTVALLLGRLARRFGLPELVGELFTGILLGPSLLGSTMPRWFAALFPQQPEQMHMLDALGQVGVILLVGVTGLHLDLSLIRKRAGIAARISLPGFVLPLALGIGAGLALPAALLSANRDRTVFALFLGIALCVSAIPVIAKTLIDMKLLHRNVGQLILMSGTVDDILGWLCLSVATGMAAAAGLDGMSVAKTVLLLIAFVVGVLVVGRPVVARVMKLAARAGSDGPTLTTTVLITVAFSAVTLAMGLEAVFGALIAGLVINGAAPQSRPRLAALRPFVMSVVAPVFFATVGLRMDLTTLAHPTVLLAAAVLLPLAVIGKFAGAWLGSLRSGLTRWEKLAVAAGMNARGVVGVIIASVGLRLGVLSTAMYTVVVLVAIVTSLMGPPVLRIAARRIEVGQDELVRLAAYENDFTPAPRGSR
jgi:Kef-type K+ transport system membrane component KefB